MYKKYIKEILRIMRLTAIILIATMMQVSANGFGQHITLKTKGAPLSKIIKEIRTQSGFDFFYDTELIKKTKPVTISVINAPIEEVLKKCFEGQPLTYKIGDKVVMLKEKVPSFLDKMANIFSGIDVRGRVVDTVGTPLAGANVHIKGSNKNVITDGNGQFSFKNIEAGRVLVISYISYITREVTIVSGSSGEISIVLKQGVAKLDEVMVSTGYQTLPKERATGSFVQVDRALIERSISTNITDRLRDVVPGLSFNPVGTEYSIRGQSTIASNAEPLIVVDGFPYNQPVNDLNPNDVESITVLKDAASASIWGARAGNGVIVIVTKKGGYNRPLQVTLNSNVTVVERPNLSYNPKMSSADYIALEQRLFKEDYFSAAENSVNNLPLSPAVELLVAQRDGKITEAQLNSQLAVLAGQDVLQDISRYIYRPSVNQQSSLSLDGGSASHRYFYSVGYDKNLDRLVGNGFDRVTLNGNNNWSLLDHKLDLTLGFNVSENGTDRNNTDFGSVTWGAGTIYPYAALAGTDGTPLAIIKDYRQSFVDAAPGKGLLDWQYRPLAETSLVSNRSTITDYRLISGIRYKVFPGLDAQLQYSYDHNLNNSRYLYGADSYYTRNLINHFTQDDGSGNLTRPIPLGGILDLGNGYSINHDFRAQFNYDHQLGTKGELTAIAGFEVQTLHTIGDEYRLYGYDSGHAVDRLTDFTYYDNPYSGNTIPDNTSETDATDNNRSYYANAAYTYDQRLTLSASARLDQSNLFGVRTNQKGVPLWSAGAAWNLSKETFYHLDWLPYLRLRATFGYNGNINKNLSAYTTATYYDGSDSQTQLPYAQIINPPNPGLRWERFQHINFGIDFGTKNERISGTFEYFLKQGLDLIGNTSYAPSSGITLFTGNTANTRGHGFDFNLTTRNLVGPLRWNTDLLLSYIIDKVTNYEQVSSVQSYLDYGNYGGYALENRPLFAIYSYQSAGLDPQTGDPRGYLNGQVSKDYNAMIGAATTSNLVYNGPSRPTFFGALRNMFNYNSWSLSANIAYEFGFYYRRTSVRYGDTYGMSQQNGDFALRWQQPGDEAQTIVPSMPQSTNISRDNFYTFSSDLVEKGDNVRLRDVRLSYTFGHNSIHILPKANLQLYLYANNLGILWRANHSHQDPDAPNSYTLPKSLAGGIRLTY